MEWAAAVTAVIGLMALVMKTRAARTDTRRDTQRALAQVEADETDRAMAALDRQSDRVPVDTHHAGE